VDRRPRTKRAALDAWPLALGCWPLALAALTLGCAFGDVNVRKPLAQDVATSARRGEGREIVLVRPFANKRPQARCGMKKNGYNMDTANVFCDVPPETFLGDLLARQLAAAGFRVLADPRAAGPSTIVLTGVVEQLFVEPKADFFYATYETDVALELTAKTGAGLVATRTFYVKGSEATMFAASEDMQSSLDSGVRQLVSGVVGAVTNLADRYPDDERPTKRSAPGGARP
jgi:hypothetical protein